MKNLLILIFTLVALTVFGQTTPKVVPTSSAKMEFKETEFNHGKIVQGPDYPHEFTFKNTGTSPLIINNVATSCGCTAPEWTKEPIMPGKTGKIVATYHSAGKMGAFDKTLTVQTSMGAGTDVYLTIKGEVIQAASTPTATPPSK